METREGYVFLQEARDTAGREVIGIFGPSDNRNPIYLQGNNITPYSSLEKVTAAARRFEKRNLRKFSKFSFPVNIADFLIKIAQDSDEAKAEFSEESDLVVIMIGDGQYSPLIGPPVILDIPTIANGVGASIQYNGLTLFNSKRGKSAFDYAEYVANQVGRQACAETRIAKLRIRIREDSFRLLS